MYRTFTSSSYNNGSWSILLTLTTLTLFYSWISINGTLAYDSSYDKDALDEFSELVQGLTTKDFMKSDGYLLRWLYYTDFDVEKAYEAFIDSLNWRKANNIDNVLKEGYSLMEENYPYSINGFDKNGRPVVFSPAGTYDIRRAVLSGKLQVSKRMIARFFEILETYMQDIRDQTGFDNITQITAVFDLAGFNLKQTACLKCIQVLPEMVTPFEPAYPVIFHRMFFINTPAIFYSALQIAKSLVSKETRESVRVFDYDKVKWSKALLEQISPDNLPIQYGGTKPNLDKSTFETRNAAIIHLFSNKQDLPTVNNNNSVTNGNYNKQSQVELDRTITTFTNGTSLPAIYDFGGSNFSTVNERESVKETYQFKQGDLWLTTTIPSLTATEEVLISTAATVVVDPVIVKTKMEGKKSAYKHNHRHHHCRKLPKNDFFSEQFYSSGNFTHNNFPATAVKNNDNLSKQSYVSLLLSFFLPMISNYC